MVNNKNLVFAKCFFLHAVCFSLGLITACSPSGPHKPVEPASQNGGELAGMERVQFSDIQAVLASRCTRCHNSGDKNWNDPKSVQRWAQSGALGAAVQSGFMPLRGSPEASAFTQEEKGKLLAWVASVLSPAQSGGEKPVEAPPGTDPNMAFLSRCTSCHGPMGTSVSEDFPNLAGHGPDYLASRLKQYLHRDEASLMGAQLKAIAAEFDQDLKFEASGAPLIPEKLQSLIDYASLYFSLLNVNLQAQEPRNELSAEEQRLYEQGKKLVQTRCLACHLQNDLRPMANSAMIFGQKRPYLLKRLQEFRQGQGTLMPSMVQDLSDQDFQAITIYLHNTKPSEGAQ